MRAPGAVERMFSSTLLPKSATFALQSCVGGCWSPSMMGGQECRYSNSVDRSLRTIAREC